MAVSDNYQQVR